MAEVKCMQLKVIEDEVARWSMEKRQAKLAEILGLVREALAKGFGGYKTLGKKEFKDNEWTFFNHLQVLNIPGGFEEPLYTASGITDP